jgi:hypothetical protein
VRGSTASVKRHRLRVYVPQDIEMVQYLGELLLEPGHVLLAESDARQTGNVQDLAAGETHRAVRPA